MSAPVGTGSDLAFKVQQYVDERRRLGFKLCSAARALPSFERFVATTGHAGPLTIELMVRWAQKIAIKPSKPRKAFVRIQRTRCRVWSASQPHKLGAIIRLS